MVWEVRRPLVAPETGKGNAFLWHPGIPASQAVAWETRLDEGAPGLQQGPPLEHSSQKRITWGCDGALGAGGEEMLGLCQLVEGAGLG